MKKFFLLVIFLVLAGTTSFGQMKEESLVTSKITKDDLFPSKVSNLEIQQMVDICIGNNGLTNPNHIEKGQLLLWEFPDNHKFQFYQDVKQDESLWIIAENLLMITADYHKEASEIIDLISSEVQKEKDSISNLIDKELDLIMQNTLEKQKQKQKEEDENFLFWVIFFGVFILGIIFIVYFGNKKK